MSSGLTIAFVCQGKDHSTITNHKKFGNKYWDDAQNNKSKIGYYFAFYFQKKYVYIHKIINILQPSERPIEMDWTSNKQILCLSKQLHAFTWSEWINGIGLGAPFTPNYRQTSTSSWSCFELQNHKKYHTFNFNNFKNTIIDTETATAPATMNAKIILYESKKEAIEFDIDDEEEIKIIAEICRKKREKELRKRNAILDRELNDIDRQIIRLQAEKIRLETEKDANENGGTNEVLIKLSS